MHKFWNTQPVVQDQSEINEENKHTSIQEAVIRPEPYKLLDGFEWCDVDVSDPNQLDELWSMLMEHYIQDKEAHFRFAYSKETLLWALCPPGYKSTYHVGIRVASKRLVAFISGSPSTIVVEGNELSVVDINFLCSIRKLRSKRLAPVLIKEVTRRCNLDNISQAFYTAGNQLPGSFTKQSYFHRSLNPVHLANVGFCAPLSNAEKKLAFLPPNKRLRPMNIEDVVKVTLGLNSFLQKYVIHPKFTEEETSHWFLPKKNVVYSYVEETNNEITHFVSFYTIQSQVLTVQNTFINTAYAFYYFYPQTNRTIHDSQELVSLFRNALSLAKEQNCDVFNCLSIMDNEDFFTELKFSEGDGALNFYLFNWRCPSLAGKDVGIVLL